MRQQRFRAEGGVVTEDSLVALVRGKTAVAHTTFVCYLLVADVVGELSAVIEPQPGAL